MGVNGSRHAPAALPPRKRHGTHHTRGRVGSCVVRAVLKFKIRLVRNDKCNKWRPVELKSRSNRTHFSQDLYVFPDRRREY
jgi:hypothetical protein